MFVNCSIEIVLCVLGLCMRINNRDVFCIITMLFFKVQNKPPSSVIHELLYA